MGSPLGPLLADIFMIKLENGPLKSLIENFDLYKRYVDDILIVCNNSLNIDNILSLFNGCHGSIKFTMERESNDSPLFLVILLIKKRWIYKETSLQKAYMEWAISTLSELCTITVKKKLSLLLGEPSEKDLLS